MIAPARLSLVNIINKTLGDDSGRVTCYSGSTLSLNLIWSQYEIFFFHFSRVEQGRIRFAHVSDIMARAAANGLGTVTNFEKMAAFLKVSYGARFMVKR